MKAAQLWQSSLTACIASALLLFTTAALPQSQAAPAKRQAPAAAKKGAPPKVTHLLHLSAIRLEKSGWTDERVLGVVRSAGRVFAQCGVKLERVELVSMAVPADFLDLTTPVAQELTRDYPVARPTVYFMRNTRNNPALEAEAFGRGSAASVPELVDTAWITVTARAPGVALAHALAHLLMDIGEHSKEPGNLMREETSPRNTVLDAAQCARLRTTATENGLLKKAN